MHDLLFVLVNDHLCAALSISVSILMVPFYWRNIDHWVEQRVLEFIVFKSNEAYGRHLLVSCVAAMAEDRLKCTSSYASR
jgi:hypothetical protein